MGDPFESLREPAVPFNPDPVFAAHLRARLARALALPKGVTVSDLTLDGVDSQDASPGLVAGESLDASASPPGHRDADPPVSGRDRMRMGDLAYVSLWVPDLDTAADFYGDVLGWQYRDEDDDVARQVAGQSLPHGLYGGQARSTLFLCFVVDEARAAVARVRAAGGQADEPTDEPYGRVANCVDDQGVPFAVLEVPNSHEAPPRVPVNGERHGDVSYVTIEVEDSAKARDFYGSVLGWRFDPGGVPDGWRLVDVAPMVGLSGGHPQATTLPMYRVEDIRAVVARLRAHGGTATDPMEQPYGLTADCVDDQGTRFNLGQH